MRNHLKSAAPVISLFALLAGILGQSEAVSGMGPDDMHWPTGSTVTVEASPAAGTSGAFLTLDG